jgi:predicted P-loop ATPase
VSETKADGKDPFNKATKMAEALKSMGYTFGIDDLSEEIYVNGQVMTEELEAAILNNLTDAGFTNFTVMKNVITALRGKGRFNPLLDYFNGLVWDGTDQITELLKHIKFSGEWASFSETLFRKWLIGVVVQVYEAFDPSCRVRYQNPMPVFVGNQGIGKSGFVQWLTPIDSLKFGKEGPLDTGKEEDRRDVCYKLLWEVGELGATTRKWDRDALKGFITQRKQTFRVPYAKHMVTKPVIVSLIGSVNKESGFLNDPTGERRFWPIEIDGFDFDYKDRINVNQLWAQVVEYYKTGEEFKLTPSEAQTLLMVQGEHKVDDPMITSFKRVFVIDSNEKWKMFTADIIKVYNSSAYSVGQLNPEPRQAGRRLGEVLGSLGLKSGNIWIGKEQNRGWVGIRPRTDVECMELDKLMESEQIPQGGVPW